MLQWIRSEPRKVYIVCCESIIIIKIIMQNAIRAFQVLMVNVLLKILFVKILISPMLALHAGLATFWTHPLVCLKKLVLLEVIFIVLRLATLDMYSSGFYYSSTLYRYTELDPLCKYGRFISCYQGYQLTQAGKC